MAPPCREHVVSELLVPTPLESDMMSLVSPALLSVDVSVAQRSVWFENHFCKRGSKIGIDFIFSDLPRAWIESG